MAKNMFNRKLMNPDKVGIFNKPAPSASRTPTGWCAKCQTRHPLEMLTKLENRYYLCENGYGAKTLEEIAETSYRQTDAANALARLKNLRK